MMALTKNDQDDDSKRNSSDSDNVCRDFLRNVCKRGKRCKYFHPEDHGSDSSQRNNDIIFCRDYQNQNCNRPNCKYIHCTREEEEMYNMSGQLPSYVQQGFSGISQNDDGAIAQGDIPVCKDYQKGNCTRGTKCKYRHMRSNGSEMRASATLVHYSDVDRVLRLRASLNGRNSDLYDLDPLYELENARIKRRRLDYDDQWRYQLLDEENILLRHKVESLKQQVLDLKATNEVLLEQNARYRLLKSSAVVATARMNHTVTQQTLSSAPSVVAATPVNHLTLTNPDLGAPQHATLQHIPAGAPGTTVGIPVSIVPVSMPQNNMTPVSMTNVSLQQTLPVAQNLSGLISYPQQRIPTSSLAL